MNKEDETRDILNNYKVIAVVGISRQKIKDSHIVAEYMKSKGYRIIPINPFADEILGEKCYKSLLEMPEEMQKQVEIVDIFRPSDQVGPIIEEAIKIREKYGNLKVVWMQLGIA
ncbi:CoA-binding protein, partial [Candidatus Bathyarchaeota archaeon]